LDQKDIVGYHQYQRAKQKPVIKPPLVLGETGPMGINISDEKAKNYQND
jgi:hypothetical protein